MNNNYTKMKKADLISRIMELETSNAASLAITNVQVFPFKDNGSLGSIRAMANIQLNDVFLIRGLRVMSGENGLYVGYPNDPFYKGEDFRCICSPITRQMRDDIEHAVLTKYQEVITA